MSKEKKEFLKYNEYKLAHKDYHLTNLMDSDNDYSVYTILYDWLEPYGIIIQGATNIFDLNKNKAEINSVYGSLLDPNIPVENIGIIKQMYGYDNAKITISLSRSEKREYAFWFNTNDESCELERLEWGKVVWKKDYKSFSDMMEDIRSKESPIKY